MRIQIIFLKISQIQFVDRNNHYYHIQQSTSPAFDFCDEFTLADHPDIDIEAHGFMTQIRPMLKEHLMWVQMKPVPVTLFLRMDLNKT